MDADAALSLVNTIYARLAARRAGFQTLEDYYAGQQPLSFATEEWKKANASRYADFSDNWCGPVADAAGERIRHTGIKLGDDKRAAQKLWTQWGRNEMDMQASQGVLSTLITSRSYVIVWGDRKTDEPIVSWEHGANVEIEYDWSNLRRPKAALKAWVDGDFEYGILYTDTELWKFRKPRIQPQDARQSQARQAKLGRAEQGTWKQWQPEGDDVWPLPNPLGEVPVVEMPNRPMLAGDPKSEIAGVMSMQDAINLLWAYLFLSADYASMPARVVLHQGPPMMPILDASGQRIGEKPVDIKELAEKRLLYLSGKDTTIDSWEAAKLDVFGDVIEMAVGHIAAQTRTPPTYLVSKTGMANVNGEGLKASEIGLVKKTLEFHTFASPALRRMYRLIALAMNDKPLADLASLATISWMNPEIRSEAQLADALVKKKQMGYPLEYLMELDGLPPEEVSRVMAMVEQEQFDPQVERAMRELSDLGDTGGDADVLPNAAADRGEDGLSS
ncbi:phage portal protein [Curtobacterium sp. BRD11]|uniref:phage portal protein n=1 Tax=Curtobacterium sp. BRD11 TaxID=2962581 RepID=UPI002880E80D|nr:phage portal protein [Curtobacterium sp. BRD11]MDT0211233.1 phage portal protein [Curtobacterium sp. BRD11]